MEEIVLFAELDWTHRQSCSAHQAVVLQFLLYDEFTTRNRCSLAFAVPCPAPQDLQHGMLVYICKYSDYAGHIQR